MNNFEVVKINQAVNKLRYYSNFRASNLFAYKDNSTCEYIIISHATIICTCDFLGRITYFDNRYYSSTTSRYQNIIQEAFCVNLKEKRLYFNDDF